VFGYISKLPRATSRGHCGIYVSNKFSLLECRGHARCMLRVQSARTVKAMFMWVTFLWGCYDDIVTCRQQSNNFCCYATRSKHNNTGRGVFCEVRMFSMDPPRDYISSPIEKSEACRRMRTSLEGVLGSQERKALLKIRFEFLSMIVITRDCKGRR
jgi:hypothetical protein